MALPWQAEAASVKQLCELVSYCNIHAYSLTYSTLILVNKYTLIFIREYLEKLFENDYSVKFLMRVKL
jgi:hypothetical protein